MNMYLKSSKKNKKNSILDLLNFNDLFFDNDILSYDNNDNDSEDTDINSSETPFLICKTNDNSPLVDLFLRGFPDFELIWQYYAKIHTLWIFYLNSMFIYIVSLTV